MLRQPILLLGAAAALATSQAQAAPYRPIDLGATDRAVPPQARTRYMVLGTPHLAGLPDSFRPEHLSLLLDRLADWRPDVITIESLPGPQCEMLQRYQANYPGVAEQYCWDAAEVERDSGVSLIAAEAALPQAVADIARAPTPAGRRHLAMLFLSANDRTSALVQWLRLPAAERKAGDGLTAPLVTLLEKVRAGRNENYALAAVLAARLGHERVYPADDHTADALTAPGGAEFEQAMMAIWDNPGARALRPAIEAQGKAMASPAGVLAGYRAENAPNRQRQQIEVDFTAALKDKSARQWGRRYVAWWEVRNLRMVAAIRAAAAQAPGGKVLALVGSSHRPYFERYLGQMHDAALVDPGKVLN